MCKTGFVHTRGQLAKAFTVCFTKLSSSLTAEHSLIICCTVAESFVSELTVVEDLRPLLILFVKDGKTVSYFHPIMPMVDFAA